MMNFIRRKIAEGRTFKELNGLTTKELLDIGITRSEIRNVARDHAAKIF